jgi:DNA invertase Pin-like site-specific DNA recombinase
MLIGYTRVSKADGSETTDLQRDALIAAGVFANHMHEVRASDKLDARPGLDASLKALRKVTPWLTGNWIGVEGISGTW